MKNPHDCSWPTGLPKLAILHERTERRDASEHRRRILEAARTLFAERGVDAVSMHQIAKAAGVGQGTLYRRYAHKGELCMDLLRVRHEHFTEDIAMMLAMSATVPALEKLDGVLAHLVAFLEEQGAMLEPAAFMMTRGPFCVDHDLTQRYAPPHMQWFLWLHELFASLLTEAIDQEELVALDVPYTADIILTTLHPLFYRFQRQERGYSVERILQGLRRIYIAGIKPAQTATNSAMIGQESLG